MSLSRLEKDQVEAESARVELLKAKALSKEVDERKLRRKVAEEEREHTRYSYKALNDNIWYYKDRSGVPRGPCTLTTVRKCWVHGVVDQYTLVWGQGLEDWYPVRNVIGLITNIQSLDVVVLKWIHDKFFLNPRLARARQARKAFAKAVNSGEAQLSADEKFRVNMSRTFGRMLQAPEEHPAYKIWAEEKAEAKEAAAAAAAAAAAPAGTAAPRTPNHTSTLACMSLALPLPADWQR